MSLKLVLVDNTYDMVQQCNVAAKLAIYIVREEVEKNNKPIIFFMFPWGTHFKDSENPC